MSYRRRWSTLTIVILGLATFIPVAQAQRQDFEALGCYAATNGIVHTSPEVVIMSVDAKGIMQSTHDSKFLENWTMHTVYVIKVGGVRRAGMGLAKAWHQMVNLSSGGFMETAKVADQLGTFFMELENGKV